MSTPLFNKERTQQLIPQRPPMVLIDELVSCDESGAETRFYINNDSPFVAGGTLQEPGLIENIAQSAAAMAGYAAHTAGKKIPPGFIGAIKDLEISGLPATGQSITTKVKITNHVMNVTIITGKVLEAGKLIASCEMKIFLQPVAD